MASMRRKSRLTKEKIASITGNKNSESLEQTKETTEDKELASLFAEIKEELMLGIREGFESEARLLSTKELKILEENSDTIRELVAGVEEGISEGLKNFAKENNKSFSNTVEKITESITDYKDNILSERTVVKEKDATTESVAEIIRGDTPRYSPQKSLSGTTSGFLKEVLLTSIGFGEYARRKREQQEDLDPTTKQSSFTMGLSEEDKAEELKRREDEFDEVKKQTTILEEILEAINNLELQQDYDSDDSGSGFPGIILPGGFGTGGRGRGRRRGPGSTGGRVPTTPPTAPAPGQPKTTTPPTAPAPGQPKTTTPPTGSGQPKTTTPTPTTPPGTPAPTKTTTPAPTTPPSRPGIGTRLMTGMKGGAAGVVGGVLLSSASDAAKEKGMERTAVGLDIASEAANWAATGAMVGSIIPGLGTATGALVGGIAGAGYGVVKNTEFLFGKPKIEAGKGAFQKDLKDFKKPEPTVTKKTESSDTVTIGGLSFTISDHDGVKSVNGKAVSDEEYKNIVKAKNQYFKPEQHPSYSAVYDQQVEKEVAESAQRGFPADSNDTFVKSRAKMAASRIVEKTILNEQIIPLIASLPNRPPATSKPKQPPEPAKSEFADVKFDATTVGEMELPEPPPPAEKKEVNAIPASELTDPEAAAFESAMQEREPKIAPPVVSQPGMAADGKGALPDPDAEMGVAPVKPSTSETPKFEQQGNQVVPAVKSETTYESKTTTKIAGEDVVPGKPLSDKQVAVIELSKASGNKYSPEIEAAYADKKNGGEGIVSQSTSTSDTPKFEQQGNQVVPVKTESKPSTGLFRKTALERKRDKVNEKAKELGITGPVQGRFEGGVLTGITDESGKTHEIEVTNEKDKRNVEAARSMKAAMTGNNQETPKFEQQGNQIVPVKTESTQTSKLEPLPQQVSVTSPSIESNKPTMVDPTSNKPNSQTTQRIVIEGKRNSLKGTLSGVNPDKDEVERRVQEKLLDYPEKMRSDVDVIKDAREEVVMEMKAERLKQTEFQSPISSNQLDRISNESQRSIPQQITQDSSADSAQKTAASMAKNIVLNVPPPTVIQQPAPSVATPFTNNIRNNETTLQKYISTRYAF